MSSESASVRPKIRSKHLVEKPFREPLERRSVDFVDRDGIDRHYPALHIKFSHSMAYHKYSSPPMKTMADMHMNGHDFGTNDAIDRWLQSVDNFEEMLKTLLRLNHNQFWSTMIYERSLQMCLESYLRHGPRGHDLDNFLYTEQMKVVIKRVHILVFKLYLRMCSLAETKTHFLSKNTFGSLIYDNHLIDVPKIIDLCVLFGHTRYGQSVSRMLSDVMECQPRYEEDIHKGLVTICEAMDALKQTLGFDDNSYESDNKLSSFRWCELQSTVCRITDISVCLQSLLQTLPQTSRLFRAANVDKTFISFYNNVFPSLQNELNLKVGALENNHLIVDTYRRQLLISRSNFVQTFRDLIRIEFLDKLMDKDFSGDSKVSLIDEWIETLTLAAFERSFINDYCLEYSVERDLSELSNHSELTQYERLDKSRVEYLRSLLQNSVSTSGVKSNSIENLNQNSIQSKDEKINRFTNNEDMNGLNVELESNVQYIREIMPSFGTEFVIKCLQYYDLDKEKVLNAIFEDNLPPHLSSMDRSVENVSQLKTTAETTPTAKISTPEVPKVIEDRHNVYNNDEFDIFRKEDIDLKRVRIGKKDKLVPKLDDKIKEKVISLHMKSLEDEENEGLGCYDDEYDDTYEDDTKIDLITDKLMDELVVGDDNDDNEDNGDNKRFATSGPQARGRQKDRYWRKSRHY